MKQRVVSLAVLLGAGWLAACGGGSDLDARSLGQDVLLPRDRETVEARVPRNATLEGLLQQQLSADLAHTAVEAVRAVFDPRDLRADRTYRITRTLDGLFREFRYDIDADNLLKVVFRERPDRTAEFDAAVVAVPKTYEPAVAVATISPEQNSLIAAFNATGENIQLPLQLAEIFGGEVDFNSELQLGDAVHVLFDRATRSGEFVGYGEVKGAVLNVGDREITAVRFVGSDGTASYYDDQGRSLRRQFRKSPLPFNPRVTSGFSYNRYHPVLGTRRPHLGVDYGAPAGTRVEAVASGVVVSAGWAGDAGRMVKIRHTGGYETAYLHLSSFARGMRAGARVLQGDLIGRVGSSGSATGPHLDYRIYKNGVAINPQTAFRNMPLGEPVDPDQLPAFLRQRDTVLGQLRGQLASSAPDQGGSVTGSL